MSIRPRAIPVTTLLNPAARQSDISAGLTSKPKSFPMKYLYTGAVDERRLFEEIAGMPDYHVAEAEARLLRAYIEPLVYRLAPTELLDIGCGCGLRVDMVLDAMAEINLLNRYIGIDIATNELCRWLDAMRARFPDVDLRGIIGDFEDAQTMQSVPPVAGQRLVVMLGQTLGNFRPRTRVELLRNLWGILNPGEPLIVGIDFTEDLASALPGYDDAAGRNAAFSLNAVAEINRALGSSLRTDDFRFRVTADETHRAIVSSLEAQQDLLIEDPLSGGLISFAAGECIDTEWSQRFDVDGLRRDFSEAGFELLDVFQDAPTSYGLAIAVPRTRSQQHVRGCLAGGERAPVLR